MNVTSTDGEQNFVLNTLQQKSLSNLLDVVCPEESKDYIVSLACRFREQMDWSSITASLSPRSAQGNIYQLDMTFSLIGAELGFIKIFVWHDKEGNYSIGLSSTDAPDFALHRYSEGPIWESLKRFYYEVEVAIAG